MYLFLLTSVEDISRLQHKLAKQLRNITTNASFSVRTLNGLWVESFFLKLTVGSLRCIMLSPEANNCCFNTMRYDTCPSHVSFKFQNRVSSMQELVRSY